MAVESFIEKRKRELREKNGGSNESASSFVERRKKELRGEVKTPEAQISSKVLQDTLSSVMKPNVTVSPTTTAATVQQKPQSTQKTIDFKVYQAAQKAKQAQTVSPLQGKLPAADLLTKPLQSNIQETLKNKVPAASLVQQTGRGPANASDIPGISQYETTKKEIADDNAPAIVKAYANVMNYATQGNPVGQAVSRSFAGNSGVTRRDSTGNKTVDKITDLVNELVTPFITPTGAPVGGGIIGSTYDATGKALSGKLGAKLFSGAEKVIPGSQNVVRVAATEALAGGMQGAAFGLQQGQDSGREIARNSLYGAAGGAVLAGAGTAIGEGLSKILRRSNIPESEVAATLEEIFTPKTEVVPKSELKTNLPETNPLALPQSPERLALPESSYKPTTARVEKQTNVYRQKFENLIEEAQKQTFSPGREDIELENLWSQMAERNDPGLDELISLAYPKRTNVPQKGMVESARANQEMREVSGVGNPVKSTAPQVFSDAAAPRQVLGRKGATGTIKEAPARTNELTREQQIQAKVNAGEYLPQEDIDYLFSGKYDKSKTFPEETPKVSTYTKPKAEIKTNTKPKAEVKPIKTEIKTKPKKEVLVNKEVAATVEVKPIKTAVPKIESKPAELTTVNVQGKKVTDLDEDQLRSVLQRLVNKKETMVANKSEGLGYQQTLQAVESDIKTVKTLLSEKKTVSTTLKPALKEVEEAIEAVKNPRIRDRVYNFADEAEQAARERIAKRKGQLNSTPLPEWTDYSIIMASKLVKGTIKVTNFTEELVKEFGEGTRQHSNKILRMSKEEIRRQEQRASKEGVEATTFNAKPEGDVSSFAEKISRSTKKEKKTFAERWQKLRTQSVDDLASLETTEKTIRGGRLASAEDSLYKAGRNFKGAPEKAAQIVDDRLAPVIRNIEKSGYTSEDLEMYALAKHAQDVNAGGYKSGFTDQEIKTVIDELESPEMIEAQQELVKVNRDMLKMLVDSDVNSQELYDVLGDRWENYIPLFRDMESDKVGFSSGMTKALANVTSPIKALKGSERQVIAPLENMVKNIFQSVNAAERNKVALQIPKLAELDTSGTFFRKLKPAEEVGLKNVVKVKVKGQDVHYEVEPETYKAIMNLDQESSNTLMNILSKPASVLRAGATLTPEFALRNPLRDINQAFVVSKSGFNPITDFGVGLIQTIKKGDLYKDWIENLGSYGNTLSMDRNVHQKALERVLKQPVSKKFVNVVNGKLLVNALRSISDATESATKVGEYRAAIRSGASKEEAAFRSRDLMDFARAGSSIRPANRIVSFLNANIQGKSKLIRAIKENPGGVVTRGVVSITLPTVGIYIANHKFANDTQKATIDNAPNWMKDSFWLMAIPGTDKVARIPKPFDLAAVFANLPEKALQYTQENDPEAFEGYVTRTLKDASLPTQISGILPIIEGMANYSFFKEGAIIPRAEQTLKFSDQYDPIRTSSTARIIAGGIEKVTKGKGSFKNFSSPRVVDNTIQGLTAGIGKYASDAIDILLDTTGVFERTDKTEKSLEQAPFTRSFLVDPNQGGQAMDKFYKSKDELTKEKASAKLNNKPFYEGEELEETDITTTMEEAMDKIEDNVGKVEDSFVELEGMQLTKKDQLDIVNDVSDAISSINKAVKLIEKGSGTSAEKKRKIDPLIKRRNELVQQSNNFFKNKVIK